MSSAPDFASSCISLETSGWHFVGKTLFCSSGFYDFLCALYSLLQLSQTIIWVLISLDIPHYCVWPSHLPHLDRSLYFFPPHQCRYYSALSEQWARRLSIMFAFSSIPLAKSSRLPLNTCSLSSDLHLALVTESLSRWNIHHHENETSTSTDQWQRLSAQVFWTHFPV